MSEDSSQHGSTHGPEFDFECAEKQFSSRLSEAVLRIVNISDPRRINSVYEAVTDNKQADTRWAGEPNF